jgi:hypothetical protein
VLRSAPSLVLALSKFFTGTIANIFKVSSS